MGYFDQAAGLGQFTEERIADPQVTSLAQKITYEIDPDNPYPDRFAGHLKVTLTTWEAHEFSRENMRGGAHAPLYEGELEEKFPQNAAFGGLSMELTKDLEAPCVSIVRGGDFGGWRRSAAKALAGRECHPVLSMRQRRPLASIALDWQT